MRLTGQKVERRSLPAVDTLRRLELEAFADAVAGRSTISAFV